MDALSEFVLARLDDELQEPRLDRQRERELHDLRALVWRSQSAAGDDELAKAFLVVLREIAARHTTHPDYREEWTTRRDRPPQR